VRRRRGFLLRRGYAGHDGGRSHQLSALSQSWKKSGGRWPRETPEHRTWNPSTSSGQALNSELGTMDRARRLRPRVHRHSVGTQCPAPRPRGSAALPRMDTDEPRDVAAAQRGPTKSRFALRRAQREHPCFIGVHLWLKTSHQKQKVPLMVNEPSLSLPS